MITLTTIRAPWSGHDSNTLILSGHDTPIKLCLLHKCKDKTWQGHHYRWRMTADRWRWHSLFARDAGSNSGRCAARLQPDWPTPAPCHGLQTCLHCLQDLQFTPDRLPTPKSISHPSYPAISSFFCHAARAVKLSPSWKWLTVTNVAFYYKIPTFSMLDIQQGHVNLWNDYRDIGIDQQHKSVYEQKRKTKTKRFNFMNRGTHLFMKQFRHWKSTLKKRVKMQSFKIFQIRIKHQWYT